MTRKERLMASLQGKAVDRPPVNFYELNGLDEDPGDSDPFNIYQDPSWLPLIELTRERTDRIVMREIGFTNAPPDPLVPFTETSSHLDENGSRVRERTVRAGNRVLTERSREDRDVRTVWTTEHLLKDADDLKAWLELPAPEAGGEPDLADALAAEEALGDTGIVMVDTPDPLCYAAQLFEMGTYTIVASTERELFTQALERFAAWLLPRTEAVARAFPGRLWRIFGPEYASPPYLSPALFRDYVVKYVTPMVESIQRYGGYARIHCHGKIGLILDDIVSTGCSGLDPIEPPPQGDVQLGDVRRRYGDRLTLFGNLEIADIENLETSAFESIVRRSIDEGTAGSGRGFVLMPSSCPYGRKLPEQTLRNYEALVRVVESL